MEDETTYLEPLSLYDFLELQDEFEELLDDEKEAA